MQPQAAELPSSSFRKGASDGKQSAYTHVPVNELIVSDRSVMCVLVGVAGLLVTFTGAAEAAEGCRDSVRGPWGATTSAH